MKLSCGTKVVIRPLSHADGPALIRGLERLSPRSKIQRFLHPRKTFTADELAYLTSPSDSHLALGLALVQDDGGEGTEIGVARCVRDPAEADLGEVAVVLADEWHHKGGATLLLSDLARRAWQVGIRRWQAFYLPENEAIRRTLSRLGELEKHARLGFGMEESIYRLKPPEGERP